MIGLPQIVNVVIMRDMPQSGLDRIEAVAPGRIRARRVVDGDGFTPEDEAALREAHVAMIGSGCPPDIKSRMPNAVWLHANFAGVTDLQDRDFWGTDVIVTSARGYTGALPIAEMALTGGLMLAKDLHKAARETATRWSGREAYNPRLISALTMGVIGLGGIGSGLARLAKGVGMRVIGTRRSVQQRTQDTDGVDELFPAAALMEMAPQCDMLAVCAPATPETYGMVNADVLNALPDGAILINIARGEIVDEDALVAALDSGKLGGAYLDVYSGERQGRDPDPRITGHPNVVMTPHISFRSHIPQSFGMNVFCDNLQRLLNGEPLMNVVDWERGY